MPTGTVTVELDLDNSRLYGTDVSDFVRWEQSLSASGLGRQKQLDRAGKQALTIHLENADGRFSPNNASGPYYPDLRDNKPFGVRVRATFDGTTYDFFTGQVVDVEVDSSIGAQTAWLVCEDRSEQLLRTEVTVPFMDGIRTGTVINRILDYVESDADGEVSNPRFARDLAGYSAFVQTAGATIERVTTGQLEGVAAMEVVSQFAGDGAELDLDADTVTGQQYRFAVYVFRFPGEGPESVELALVDSVGSVGTQSTTLLDGEWTRCEIAGTFSGTSRVLQVYPDLEFAETTFIVGAVHKTVEGAAIDRSVSPGTSRVTNLSYNRQPAANLIEEVRQSELLALFYFDAAGNAVFEDAHFRWEQARSRTAQYAYARSWDALRVSQPIGNRISHVTFDYQEWEEGIANSLVFALTPVPREIPPKVGSVKGRLAIDIDFEGGLVRGPVVPAANTHYFVNTDPDGAGTDASGDIEQSFEFFGGGAYAVLENDSTSPRWLLSYEMRGRPVRVGTGRTSVTATASAGPEVSLPLLMTFRLNTDRNKLQGAADYFAEKYGPATDSLELTISAPWPLANETLHEELLAQVLGSRVSDRVVVDDTACPWSSAVDGEFYIESISPRVLEGGRVSATFALSPADADYLVYDEGEYDNAEIYAPV